MSRNTPALGDVTSGKFARSDVDDVRAIQELYGVHYWEPGETAVWEAPDDNLYYYRCYIGPQPVVVEKGDCAFVVDIEGREARLVRGPAEIRSRVLATVVRGYMPESRRTSITTRTVLPYVNGCSTKQLFPPDRPGDPTLQLLRIPPHSAEQAHHIHPTTRVVLTLEGCGNSVIGMEGLTVTEKLVPGKVCILEPMCPHHFETPYGEHLVVVPCHVFSTVPHGIETQHPMFNGTILMSQQ